VGKVLSMLETRKSVIIARGEMNIVAIIFRAAVCRHCVAVVPWRYVRSFCEYIAELLSSLVTRARCVLHVQKLGRKYIYIFIYHNGSK